MNNAELGRDGEERAVRHLKKEKYILVRRNYRCPAGEIDIIAKDGDRLCFIEVKTRRSLKFGKPQDAVNAVKRKKIMRAALYFLKETKMENRSFRFDVVAVMDEVKLFKDAFCFNGGRYII